jgi:tRNA (guanine37-N1)-methyltransferase
MLVEPLVKCIEAAKESAPSARVILFSPSGPRLTQKKVVELSTVDSLILVCGRYEGIDQRVVDLVVDEEISLGDYVMMGGEVPAMALIEACLRLRPDAIHNSESVKHESFSENLAGGTLVEAPQYTRPEEFRGAEVPAVLLSGNHKHIEEWRLTQAKTRTKKLQEEK